MRGKIRFRALCLCLSGRLDSKLEEGSCWEYAAAEGFAAYGVVVVRVRTAQTCIAVVQGVNART